MHDDNGKPLISTLYNLLFDPEMCDWLFYRVLHDFFQLLLTERGY